MAKFESVGSDKFHTRLNGSSFPPPDGARLVVLIGMDSFTVRDIRGAACDVRGATRVTVTKLSPLFAYIADSPCPKL